HAIETLEAAVKTRPDNAQWMSNLAAAYAAGGQLDKAIEISERILVQNPEMEKTRNNLATWRSAELGARSAEEGSFNKEHLLPRSALRIPRSPLPTLVQTLRSRFPQIKAKLDRAASAEFEDLPEGLKLKEGYLGSFQSASALKPEERLALEALAK